MDPVMRLRRASRARRRARRLGSLVCIAWLALAAAGCEPDAAQLRARDARPNIVIVSLDTTRADHLSAYGYERPTSPRLEALAAQGLRFDAAYAPSATTGPSHASLFTSLAPMAHDVRKNGQVLSAALPTLAEELAAAGYETAGIVSSFVLSRRFGFAQGFGVWDEDFSRASAPEGVTVWEGLEIEGKFYGSAEDTTRRAIAWLDGRARPEAPFLLFVHYFDPHDPYTPPPGFAPPFDAGPKAALKHERTVFLYDWLIAFADAQMGVLFDGLDARGLGENTLVVVVGDHGEGLMDHGHPFHGAQIYEEAVRVPFVVRWPGRIEAGRVEKAPVPIVDLAPTLLQLAGLPQGRLGADGRARADRWLEAREAGDDAVFLYRRHYEPAELMPGFTVAGEQFGVRQGRWKLIDAPDEGRRELYDLEADPGERTNLVDREPERTAALLERLDRWRADADGQLQAWRSAAGEHAPGPQPELDAQSRARLEALGYVE